MLQRGPHLCVRDALRTAEIFLTHRPLLPGLSGAPLPPLPAPGGPCRRRLNPLQTESWPSFSANPTAKASPGCEHRERSRTLHGRGPRPNKWALSLLTAQDAQVQVAHCTAINYALGEEEACSG